MKVVTKWGLSRSIYRGGDIHARVATFGVVLVFVQRCGSKWSETPVQIQDIFM